MENNLEQYITREFYKLHAEDKQRSFIENFRFLMMSNNIDFQNYYSCKVLNQSEFYSVVDTLYELNNFWMLSEFLHLNRQVLYREVSDILKQNRLFDFDEPCKLGKDTILSRIFQVLNNYTTDKNIVAEEPIAYNVCTHKLKVYATKLNNHYPVPQILLQGKWVERFGFSVGSNIRVECYPNRLIVFNESHDE